MYLVRKVYLLEELFSSYIIIRVLIIIIRDIFDWESKVIQDCIGLTLLRSVIGPESSCHFLNQLDVKVTTIMTWSPAFSRALGSLVVFTSSSHLLVKMFFFPLIDCCDSFCFALTTGNQKALDWKIKVRKWESLLDWSFCLLNFSFSLRLQLIHFSSFDNIICLSITEGQDQNDRDWVLGVLVRTLGKIVFYPRVLSLGFYLKEIPLRKLSSIVSNWSKRSTEEHYNFPFQPLKATKRPHEVLKFYNQQ